MIGFNALISCVENNIFKIKSPFADYRFGISIPGKKKSLNLYFK
jgi:hypothetical protein